MEIFLSNQLEVLYQQLKKNVFNSDFSPFQKRIVVVYGPAMEQWLMMRMAQDGDLSIAMGIEFIYYHHALERFFKMGKPEVHFPTYLELALAIEWEIAEILNHYEILPQNEQLDWEPIKTYLKESSQLEKRITSLSQQMARLFLDYGKFGYKMIAEWVENPKDWQAHLWKKIYQRNWTVPSLDPFPELKETFDIPPSHSIFFFSISFIPPFEFKILQEIAKKTPLCCYFLSPCSLFWSDIKTDRENAHLLKFSEKKPSISIDQLEELLNDRNPILANCGKMGREMARQFEESSVDVHAMYLLEENAQQIDDHLLYYEDIFLKKGASPLTSPLTLLHALQADLILMRNPSMQEKIDIQERVSIQLHQTPNKRREIEVLYHNILKLIDKDPSLLPSDIMVMAPSIDAYIPYIQAYFGSKDSCLSYHLLDLGLHLEYEIVKGFLILLDLSESRWEGGKFLELLSHPLFQNRHQITSQDYLMIKKWIKELPIFWGENIHHRNELLRKNHCSNDRIDESNIGTWDNGLERLLSGLFKVLQEDQEIGILPYPMEFSHYDILQKCVILLHSLREDLKVLQEKNALSIENWTNYLNSLLGAYFQPVFDDKQSTDEYDELKKTFDILKNSALFLKEALYPFSTIKTHLKDLLKRREMSYREDVSHAIKCCSLAPLRSIPAKVIALIGMDEEQFPRKDQPTSLNRMKAKENVDYKPSLVDFDRYLFLEILHSAQNYLLLSYQGVHPEDDKELKPSPVIQELVSYFDKFYQINGKKFSEGCVFKHPLTSLNPTYFLDKEECHFSIHHFKAAKILQKRNKKTAHVFVNHLIPLNLTESLTFEKEILDIKHLAGMLRNPIKHYLNHQLEIYFRDSQEKTLQESENLTITPLDKYQMRQKSLRTPLPTIFNLEEKKGKLPFGPFKTIAKNNFQLEHDELLHQIQEHVDLDQLYSIEFCTTCRKAAQINDKEWVLPAIPLNVNNKQIAIVGKLSYATPKGFLALAKGSFTDIWKHWPYYLIYCHSVPLISENFEKDLILCQSNDKRSPFFNDPLIYLKKVVEMYILGSKQCVPLMPEWIPLIWHGDVSKLKEKIQNNQNAFGAFQSPELRWLFNPNYLPNVDEFIMTWKPYIENLLGDFPNYWKL